MTLKFHHIHLKARDVEKTAAWYEAAFGFKVFDKGVRGGGDAFANCKSPDGVVLTISGEKKGETLPKGSSDVQFGLEHFAVHTEDFEGELAKLKSHGAKFLGDPVTLPNGVRYQFIEAPDDVRIEVMYFPKG